MWPREHGAYGQLLLPLGTALAVGRPGAAALALAAAAVGAFLAHEPLLVLVGHRGARAAREQRDRARLWFAGLASVTAVLGGIGIALAASPVRLALLVPTVGGMACAAMILARREHTAAGEIVVAVTLASIAFPLALAAGAPRSTALTCAIVFASAFVVATVSVRAVIWSARGKGTAPRVTAVAASIVVVLALELLGRIGVADRSAPIAAAPICAAGALLAIIPPPPARLRAVGWTLVVTTIASAVVLIVGLR